MPQPLHRVHALAACAPRGRRGGPRPARDRARDARARRHRADPPLVPAALERGAALASTAREAAAWRVRGGHRPGAPGGPRAACSSRSSSRAASTRCRCSRRPATRTTAGCGPPRASARRRTAVRRGPGLRWHPAREAARGRSTPRARSPCCPAIGYDEPRPVPLHLAPLLGGRRRSPARRAPAGWAAARRVGTADNPLQGAVARRLALAGARQPRRCRSRRSTGPSYDLWAAGVWGEPRGARCSARSASSGRAARLARTSACAPAGRRPRRPIALRTQLEPFSARSDHAARRLPEARTRFGDSLAALAAMLARRPADPLRGDLARRATRHPRQPGRRLRRRPAS